MEENVVYVLDKKEQLIAVFNKEDKDTLINPRIVEIQNAEATLTDEIIDSEMNKIREGIKKVFPQVTFR